MKTIAVIGAGLGGLSASIKLASKGYNVHVYDKNEYAGGKMMPVNLGTHHFDFGPNTMTMPEIFDSVFEEANLNPRDYYTWMKLDHHTRNIDYDGQSFMMSTDESFMIEQLQNLDSFAANHYPAYLKEIERLYHLSKSSFFPRMFTKWNDYLSPTLFRAVIKVRPLEKMNHFHERYFQHPLLLKAFNRYSTYIGSSPFLSPATFAMIGYLEMVQGVYYVKGGNTKLAESLESAAKQLGVTFHLNTEVNQVHVENKKAKQIETASDRLDVDKVIINGDLLKAYPALVNEKERPSMPNIKIEGSSPSISAFVIMAGLSTRLPDLVHHQVYFAQNYSHEFETLFKGEWPDDPTIYISNSSATDPSISPDGDNLFILVNAPPLSENNQISLEKYKEKIYDKLEKHGLPIRKHLVTEKVIGPEEIKERFYAFRGALYGISSNSLKNSFLRPSNQSKDISNIYFAGGSTHPGGGSPMVVISGKNVADRIIREDH
ncbi:phytoene desaturase [Alkalihalobacillus hwajinpoensis]|uniref:phytoene desaturase family protein n=1 Tax=Guptibacillus hwajinpoensis TaxID=208199 RepID=UPI00188406A9|nr:phytoene desaturase family protein [Pseudalkalibacillus hwajinpoensis]MBF0708653.1 phytoene desaturase [Pseudalkalibacillus hwajinpoensis]